jgi:hypothetical protein
MQEEEVIRRANELGVRAMSKKEIQETLSEVLRLKNRLEDLDVSIDLFGLLPDAEALEFSKLRCRGTELAQKVRMELLRKRDEKEFISYR